MRINTDKCFLSRRVLFWPSTEGIWIMECLAPGPVRGVYFVTRQKENANYIVIGKRPLPENRNILKDEIIQLGGYYAHQKCPNSHLFMLLCS
jgi:hypothetical protein